MEVEASMGAEKCGCGKGEGALCLEVDACGVLKLGVGSAGSDRRALASRDVDRRHIMGKNVNHTRQYRDKSLGKNSLAPKVEPVANGIGLLSNNALAATS